LDPSAEDQAFNFGDFVEILHIQTIASILGQILFSPSLSEPWTSKMSEYLRWDFPFKGFFNRTS
jgi:hypothetical protein